MKYYFSNLFKGESSLSLPSISSFFFFRFRYLSSRFVFSKTSLLHRAKYCFKETVKRYLLGSSGGSWYRRNADTARKVAYRGRKGKKILFKMRRELQTIPPCYNEYFRRESTAITMFRSFSGLLRKYARVGFTFPWFRGIPIDGHRPIFTEIKF